MLFKVILFICVYDLKIIIVKMAENNANQVIEDFSCGDTSTVEIYNPGRLYDICVDKFTDYFYLI